MADPKNDLYSVDLGKTTAVSKNSNESRNYSPDASDIYNIDLGNTAPLAEGQVATEVPPLTDYLKYKFRKGRIPLVRGAWGDQAMRGKMSSEEALEGGNAAYLEQLEAAGDLEDVGFRQDPVKFFLGEAAELAPYMIESMAAGAKDSITFGGGYAKVPGLSVQAQMKSALKQTGVNFANAVASGMKVGFVHGIIRQSIQTEGGNMFLDLKEKHPQLSDHTNRVLSITSGTIVGLIEATEMGTLAAPYKRALTKALVAKPVKSVLLKVVGSYVKTVAAEIVQEEIQEIVGLATETIAAQMAEDPNAAPTAEEWRERLTQVALKGGAGMAVLALPGGVVEGRSIVKTARQEQTIADSGLKVIKDEEGRPVAVEKLEPSEEVLADAKKREAAGKELTVEEQAYIARDKQEKGEDLSEGEVDIIQKQDKAFAEASAFFEGKKAEQMTKEARIPEDEIEAQKQSKRAEASAIEAEISFAKESLGRRIKDKEFEGKKVPKMFRTNDPNALSLDQALEEANTSLAFGRTFRDEAALVDFLQDVEAKGAQAKQLRLEAREETVRMWRSTMDKKMLKKQAQGLREGKIAGRKEMAEVQTEVINMLEESNLPAKDFKKFMRAVKNIQTEAQLEKQIGSILERIEKLEERSATRSAKHKLNKILKSGKLKKQSGKVISKFGPEAQEVLDSLRDISKMTQDQARLELFSRLKSYEETNTMPTISERLENRYLEIKSGSPIITAQDISSFVGDLNVLLGEGKEAIESKLAKEAEENQQNREEALKVIRGGGEQARSKGTDIKEKKTLAQKLRTVGARVAGWDDKMDIISYYDKTSKVFGSALNEIFNVTPIEQREKGIIRIAVSRVSDAAKEIYGLKTERELLRKFRDLNKEHAFNETFIDSEGLELNIDISKDEAIKLWMEMQDPTLKETFTEGMSYTQEIFDAIDNFLTKEDKAFANAQLEFYREFYNEVINPAYRDAYGVNLPYNEYYSPIIRVGHKVKETSADFLTEVRLRASIAPGGLKARQENTLRLQKQSSVGALSQHVADMAHFVAWYDMIKKMNSVFKDAEVRSTIDEHHGSVIRKSITEDIDKFTRGGAERSKMFSAVEKLRIHFTQAALGGVLFGRPALAVKQLVSFVAYAETIPTAAFISGLKDFVAHPAEAVKTLNESELIKDRGRSLTRDIKDIERSKEFSAFRKSPNFKNSLLLMTRLGDIGAIYAGGWTVYKHHLNKTGDKAKAMAAFEKTTQSTQQSADLSQLSLWQTGGPFQRLFTMFSSSQNQYLRKELSAIRGLMSKRMSPKQAAKTIAIYHFVLPMMFQWVSDLGKWKGKRQLRAAIMGSFNGLFILSDMMEAIIASLQGDDAWWTSTPAFDWIQDLTRAINTLKAEDIDFDDILTALSSLSDAGGAITGLPLKDLYNKFVAYQKLKEGEKGQAAAIMVGWSPYAVEAAFSEDE